MDVSKAARFECPPLEPRSALLAGELMDGEEDGDGERTDDGDEEDDCKYDGGEDERAALLVPATGGVRRWSILLQRTRGGLGWRGQLILAKRTTCDC